MNKETRLFSYIIPYDCGKAPNPWWEVCTLALCKPIIRKTANVGDWVVALSTKSTGNKLVYAMQISEKMPLTEYYQDPRFAIKKPDFKTNDIRIWMGDNIYEKSQERITQHVSAHNLIGRTKDILNEKKERDLNGQNVLIADLFFYYGGNAQAIPKDLDFLILRRGHKVFGIKEILNFERKAGNLLKEPGIHGEPKILHQEAKKLEYLHNK